MGISQHKSTKNIKPGHTKTAIMLTKEKKEIYYEKMNGNQQILFKITKNNEKFQALYKHLLSLLLLWTITTI